MEVKEKKDKEAKKERKKKDRTEGFGIKVRLDNILYFPYNL